MIAHLLSHLAPPHLPQYRRASDTTNEADPGRQELINECPGIFPPWQWEEFPKLVDKARFFFEMGVFLIGDLYRFAI